MKRITFGIASFAVIAILFGSVGIVSAQSENPPQPGYGPGDRGCGPMQNNDERGTGWMHDTMIAILSEKLDVSTADLESRLDDGESMADIAADEGFTGEEFAKLMRDARGEALDQAVKDGKITQDQADWMKTRGMRMMRGMQEFRENWGRQRNP
jgi:hypothetical protein